MTPWASLAYEENMISIAIIDFGYWLRELKTPNKAKLFSL
jgi:hypothetical protein